MNLGQRKRSTSQSKAFALAGCCAWLLRWSLSGFCPDLGCIIGAVVADDHRRDQVPTRKHTAIAFCWRINASGVAWQGQETFPRAAAPTG